MTNDEQQLRRWMEEQADYNDNFRGDLLDERKMDRLNALRSLCRELSETENGIENPFSVFDNECRNGTAQISLPEAYFFQTQRGAALLSDIIASADDVCVSSLSGRIVFTFGIRDMWTEYHYEGYED